VELEQLDALWKQKVFLYVIYPHSFKPEPNRFMINQHGALKTPPTPFSFSSKPIEKRKTKFDGIIKT